MDEIKSRLECQYYSASLETLNKLYFSLCLPSFPIVLKVSRSQISFFKVKYHPENNTVGHYSQSIHLTILQTTELKPYQKIPDDRKKIFSINSTSEEKGQRGLQ